MRVRVGVWLQEGSELWLRVHKPDHAGGRQGALLRIAKLRLESAGLQEGHQDRPGRAAGTCASYLLLLVFYANRRNHERDLMFARSLAARACTGQGDAGEALGEDAAGVRQGRVHAGAVLAAARRRERPRRALAHPRAAAGPRRGARAEAEAEAQGCLARAS